MKKKIARNFLAVALVIFIAGCGNSNAEQQSQVDQETVVQEDILMEEISEESMPEENEGQTEEITLSEKEQKDIQMLVSMLSLNSYFYGGDMYGGHYPAEDVSVNMKLMDILGNMGLTDSSYMKYLPPTEVDDATLIRYCSAEDVRQYLKNVFGMENVDIFAFCEGDRAVFDMVGDFVLTDTTIDHVEALSEQDYIISGTFSLWNTTDVMEAAYPYELAAIKNEESPFGFQMVFMEFGEEIEGDYELEAQAEQTAGDGTLGDILLNPEGNSAYYPQKVEYQHILFALLDIDQDGENEILLGSARDINPYWGAEWVTIFNILKYDKSTGKVSDFDGDMIYKPLDANSWHYYDTGILMTMVEAGEGHTNFWNLLTGEFTDAALWVADDRSKDPDSEGHSVIYNADGTKMTGADADQYYQSLKSGNEIRIIWCEVNQVNVEALLNNGTMIPVYIPMPYGRYIANRGFELEFFSDNTVRVSEGNSSTKRNFTIDGMGNLVIDPDGEAIEGFYDSLADEIRIDALKFRK